jgi:hypothetical protein
MKKVFFIITLFLFFPLVVFATEKLGYFTFEAGWTNTQNNASAYFNNILLCKNQENNPKAARSNNFTLIKGHKYRLYAVKEYVLPLANYAWSPGRVDLIFDGDPSTNTYRKIGIPVTLAGQSVEFVSPIDTTTAQVIFQHNFTTYIWVWISLEEIYASENDFIMSFLAGLFAGGAFIGATKMATRL